MKKEKNVQRLNATFLPLVVIMEYIMDVIAHVGLTYNLPKSKLGQ
jgi:hypothetical protein